MPPIVPRPPLDAASQREQDQLLVTFGNAVRALRKARELSMEATAHAAGLHTNYLGEVERGKRNISLFNIWRLAAALDLPATKLLDELPNRKAEPAGKSAGMRKRGDSSNGNEGATSDDENASA